MRNANRRLQLELQDSSGFTVAMHAARSGDVAVLGAVIEDIQELKVRRDTDLEQGTISQGRLPNSNGPPAARDNIRIDSDCVDSDGGLHRS